VVTAIVIPAAMVAVVVMVVVILVKVKLISCFSFEGGFNAQSSEGTTGQDLFSPVLRFPGESVTKLYKRVTDERLLIEMEGVLKMCRSAVFGPTVIRDLTFMGLCIVNVFFKYNQQDATLYNILYYRHCSTCFRRFLRPSSGVQKLYTQHRVYVRLACCFRYR